MTNHLFALVPLILTLGATASDTRSAIVIRHDVDDSRYHAPASEFPALADLPGEGHGVLIAPRWIVTVAHTVTDVREITLDGVPREVRRVIVHPGFERLPDALIAEALASGDASKAMEHQASSRDIALIELVEPVADVAPAILYRGRDELGKRMKLMGRGATGDGAAGLAPDHSRRGVLRRAFNTISSADSLWLGYVFDSGPSADELEGASGAGDSGGPVLIEVDGRWQLAGLIAWQLVEGDVAAFRPGVYGQTSFNVRLSSYVEWIESQICSEDPCSSRCLPEGEQRAVRSDDAFFQSAAFTTPTDR